MITYIVRLEQRDDNEVEEIEVATLAEAEEMAEHFRKDDFFSSVEIYAYGYIPGKRKRKALILKNEDKGWYNVQLHISIDGGENFFYCGLGRWCETLEEVEKYINENVGRKEL
ncbi:MAG: hypothetical protein IJ601_04415 [Acidaminococcaceae bacterium]|nr:hypothetical protein [Acidaminococcaceae bacterium]